MSRHDTRHFRFPKAEREEFGQDALEELVETINRTGGLRPRDDDDHRCPGPETVPDWGDLGKAYLWACNALGKKPKYARKEKPVKKKAPNPVQELVTQLDIVEAAQSRIAELREELRRS